MIHFEFVGLVKVSFNDQLFINSRNINNIGREIKVVVCLPQKEIENFQRVLEKKRKKNISNNVRLIVPRIELKKKIKNK